MCVGKRKQYKLLLCLLRRWSLLEICGARLQAGLVHLEMQNQSDGRRMVYLMFCVFIPEIGICYHEIAS